VLDPPRRWCGSHCIVEYAPAHMVTSTHIPWIAGQISDAINRVELAELIWLMVFFGAADYTA